MKLWLARREWAGTITRNYASHALVWADTSDAAIAEARKPGTHWRMIDSWELNNESEEEQWTAYPAY